VPGGWVSDTDDERISNLDERITRLDEAMFDPEYGMAVKMARYEASNKVWAIVLATIVSVAFGIAQSWFSKPTTADEVKAAVEDLTKELQRINRDAEARQR